MIGSLLAEIHDDSSTGDHYVQIDKATFDMPDIHLMLSVWVEDGDQRGSEWEVTVYGVRSSRITDTFGELNIYGNEHTLVRLHCDLEQDLFFKGSCESVNRLVGELMREHKNVVGDWVAYERYMNSNMNIWRLLEGGYGFLARGPQFLMQVYANVLVKHGITPSFPPPTKSKWWDGEKYIADAGPLSALVIGSTYFVAAEISAIRC